MATDNSNSAKDKTMELAEDSREADWKFPSFTAELFRGNFRWDLLHEYPEQTPEEKKIGDDYIEKLRERTPIWTVFDEDPLAATSPSAAPAAR